MNTNTPTRNTKNATSAKSARKNKSKKSASQPVSLSSSPAPQTFLEDVMVSERTIPTVDLEVALPLTGDHVEDAFPEEQRVDDHHDDPWGEWPASQMYGNQLMVAGQDLLGDSPAGSIPEEDGRLVAPSDLDLPAPMYAGDKISGSPYPDLPAQLQAPAPTASVGVAPKPTHIDLQPTIQPSTIANAISIPSVRSPPLSISRFTPSSTPGLTPLRPYSPALPKVSDVTASGRTSTANANAYDDGQSAAAPAVYVPTFADSDEEDNASGPQESDISPVDTISRAQSRGPLQHVIEPNEPRTFRYPSFSAPTPALPTNTSDRDRVLFAQFCPYGKGKTWLFIGYESGLQVWDVTRLDGMVEMLHVRSISSNGRKAKGRDLIGNGNEREGVVQAGILPSPLVGQGQMSGRDLFERGRPLIGVITLDDAGSSQFLAYSLSSHKVVKTFEFKGKVVEFQASERFVVVSSAQPAAIHVLSPYDLEVIYTVESEALALKPSMRPWTLSNTVSSPQDLVQSTTSLVSSPAQPRPVTLVPTFSLSTRLLAYASTSPSTSPGGSTSPFVTKTFGLGPVNVSVPPVISNAVGSGIGAVSGLGSGLSGIGGGLSGMGGVTQRDIGSAALKVGGGLLSGMKVLGGMAVAAARSASTAANTGANTPMPASPAMHPRVLSPSGTAGDGGFGGGGGGRRTASGGFGMFFSKSAPAATSTASSVIEEEGDVSAVERLRRRISGVAAASRGGLGGGVGGVGGVEGGNVNVNGPAWVVVLDLQPLLPFSSESFAASSGPSTTRPRNTSTSPRMVTKILAFGHQGCVGLRWSRDGTSVGVVSRDGTVVRVFGVRPDPMAGLEGGMGERDGREERTEETGHIVRFPAGSSPVPASSTAATTTSPPTSIPLPSTEPISSTVSSTNQNTNIHTYTLRRGRTSANIASSSVLWSPDCRWVGVGTGRGTVHVFAVNPGLWGGKADGRGYVGGSGSGGGGGADVGIPQTLPTEVAPIARIRVKMPSAALGPPGQAVVPPAFIFLPTQPSALPASLIPTPSSLAAIGTSTSPLGGSSTSLHSSPRRRPQSLSISPGFSLPGAQGGQEERKRPTNYQDVLVFEPAEGVVSLRRMVIGVRGEDGHGIGGFGGGDGGIGGMGISVPIPIPIPGATSISLPGMGMLGRRSSASSHPPSQVGVGRSYSQSGSPSGLSRMMREEGAKDRDRERRGERERERRLVAKEGVVASWGVARKGKEVKEVREVVKEEGVEVVKVGRQRHRDRERSMGGSKSKNADWLSHAELSTCSKSLQVLPGSIYLSHQFSFYAFGEDYHALIRRMHFDVPVEKIPVRKEVEASANFASSSHGEGFIQQFQSGTSPQDIRRARSSFDEPLASAIGAGMRYEVGSSPRVIPMFPNGTPGMSGSRSAGVGGGLIGKAGVAMHVVEGVGEGIGRLRRGVGRVRSPKTMPLGSGATSGVMGSGGMGGGTSVPLEFDEEDEDFMLDEEARKVDEAEASSANPPSVEAAFVGSPHTDVALASHPILIPAAGSLLVDFDPGVTFDVNQAPSTREGGEGWEAGWEEEDRRVLEEAERYDEISAVGFMDEEQEEMRAEEMRRARAAAASPSSGSGTGKKAKRRKK